MAPGAASDLVYASAYMLLSVFKQKMRIYLRFQKGQFGGVAFANERPTFPLVYEPILNNLEDQSNQNNRDRKVKICPLQKR